MVLSALIQRFMATGIVLLTLSTLPSYAQHQQIAAIDSILTAQTAKDQFSGAILIADSSGILLSKGYGWADRERKVKNTPDTRFSLSSASKVFTGTAITLLVRQGKLQLSDTVGMYIKDFPGGQRITTHQLLTHSSGVDDFFKAPGFSYKNIRNCTDMLPFLRQLPLAYPPGDSCAYSTGDCIVLGAIIEKITGKPFPGYIQSAFIDKLNLQHTSFTPYWQLDSTQRQFAIGYRKTPTGYTPLAYNYDQGSIPLSAGGAWSSVTDLYRFNKAVFSGELTGNDFLRQMTGRHTTQWENTYFGYTWITSVKKGYHSIGHPGDSSGWHAMNEYYPGRKYMIILLTNFGSVDQYALTNMFEEMLFKDAR